MAIEIGQEAPDFTLKDPAGEDVTALVVPRLEERGAGVLPLAFSSVCTRQLTESASTRAGYAEGDAQVLGISVDSRYSQGRFAQELGLTDTILLADFEPKGAVVALRRVQGGPRLLGAGQLRHRQGRHRAGVSRTDTRAETPDEEEYFAALAVCESAGSRLRGPGRTPRRPAGRRRPRRPPRASGAPTPRAPRW